MTRPLEAEEVEPVGEAPPETGTTYQRLKPESATPLIVSWEKAGPP